MGKTTVFIDEVLIRHALQLTNLRTKKEVIEAGLRELFRKRNQRNDLGSHLQNSITFLCFKKIDKVITH
jgi:Arc/MetJ family transcription regulator